VRSSSDEEEEESDGGRPPREVDSPTPVTTGHGGSCGVGSRGERGGTRHRVICGGASERRRGALVPPEPLRKRKQGFSNLR
jgi:hypothetical protein